MRFSPILISLMGGFALLLLCLVPGVSLAGSPDDYDVRALHVLKSDNAGVPLSYPSTVFYDAEADETYITNAGKGQVVISAADYFPQLSVGEGRGLFNIHSTYVKDRKIYFCQGRSKEDSKGHISVYSAALMPLKKIYFSGNEGLDTFLPRKMVIGKNGLMYVVGVNSTAVMVLDQDGRFLRQIVPKDEVLGVPEKAEILSLTIDSRGRLYFLSEGFSRVYVYDQEENFLFKFGQQGGSSGKLSRPRGIAVDDKYGRVYLVDYMRHTVAVHSIDGEYLFEFGGLGRGRGWFNFPTDVAVDGRGNVLITDTFNHRVQVFKIIDQRVEQPSPLDVRYGGTD